MYQKHFYTMHTHYEGRASHKAQFKDFFKAVIQEIQQRLLHAGGDQ